jgi:uncharacterized membrane protein
MTRTSGLRRAAWWAAWAALTFGLFNACLSHREAHALGRELASGRVAFSPAVLVQAVRAAYVDDSDINRYHAYANAILGRPYQGFFIQRLDVWRRSERPRVAGTDPEDPAVVPPVVPVRALTPYRDFSTEHLPVLFAIALPVALAADNIDVFRTIFSLVMALLLTLALIMAERIGRQLVPDRSGAIVRWAVVFALATGVILVRRYDAVVPLGLCVLAWGAVTKRPVAAGLGLGLAVAAKGVPAIVVPVVLIFWLANRRPRHALVALCAAALLGLAFATPAVVAAGASVLDLVRYHSGRPLQVESTWGAILVASRAFDPASAVGDMTYSSLNVTATWDTAMRYAAVVLPFAWLAAVCGWLWTMLNRVHDDRARGMALVAAICVALVGWMVFGKVFSPQYLTWILPLAVVASVARGRGACWHLLVVLAMSQAIFPFIFAIGAPDAGRPWFGVVVLARNGLLVAWAVNLLRQPAQMDPLQALRHE